jgi:hypothetical protein
VFQHSTSSFNIWVTFLKTAMQQKYVAAEDMDVWAEIVAFISTTSQEILHVYEI